MDVRELTILFADGVSLTFDNAARYEITDNRISVFDPQGKHLAFAFMEKVNAVVTCLDFSIGRSGPYVIRDTDDDDDSEDEPWRESI